MVASLFYLAMACMVMDTYWFYKDVPRHVYFADDDSTWWNYFINCTDDEHIPENVTYADDDYTWMDWYNNTAFAEDDIVWLPRIANADAPGIEAYVSKYMILYFLAALGFMITGAIEIVLSRKAIVWVRVLYYLMFLAAAFGLVSAILTNKSPLWSNITNLLSTNLWALEAIFIVFQRLQGTDEGMMYEEEKIWGWGIKKWFWVADISFLIGTLGDAITSFFYVFEYDNYKLGISAILFALMWQICAFVYLAVAIYDWKQYRVYFDILGKPTGGIGGGSLRKEESAIPPGVITTTGVPIVAGGGSKATQSAVSSPPSSNDGEEKETGAAAASSSTTPLPNTVVLERPTVV